LAGFFFALPGDFFLEAFFATLFRLLQEQLGERLELPASSITEAVIEEHLRPRGVPEPVRVRVDAEEFVSFIS